MVLNTAGLYNKTTTPSKLPNAGKKAKITRHADDPKGSRATISGRKNKPKLPPSTKTSSKPKVLYTDGPTDGTPDDLKKIKGIGPKFEGDLNSKGIYYYRQIGAWKAADVKMVEALIDSIPGRIKRDEWVKQGKALAKKSVLS